MPVYHVAEIGIRQAVDDYRSVRVHRQDMRRQIVEALRVHAVRARILGEMPRPTAPPNRIVPQPMRISK